MGMKRVFLALGKEHGLGFIIMVAVGFKEKRGNTKRMEQRVLVRIVYDEVEGAVCSTHSNYLKRVQTL